MPNPILKSALMLAFTTLSALAVAADDPPARVGRVALTQGQVSIGGDVGAEMNPAQVNWPVTTGTMLTTAAGARTELRIGSTSIRLDGDSSLEVVELDDDSIRLRLHYGSASVRIANADVLRGFELVTPQARIHLQQPGRVRIDAERVRDTSAVNVFDGAALVESGGSQLTVRAGKRAEVTDDDMRTAGAVQDGFDSWSAARDKLEDRAASSRYVTTEMTGYEDLDRYGSWRTDSEYGPLWTPSVAADWVPYRDGSWTWIDPWGWTWVDNAPWGYAPFHYGRWVQVNRRWAWAPGSRAEHLVWAPALVGWVGGADWNITFRDRSRRPGFGWYPLTPHDRYVPSWHASDNHEHWLNSHVRPDPHRGRDYRPQGLTVVPHDRFGPGRGVNVRTAPIATVAPSMGRDGVPLSSAPPAPPNRPHRGNMADRDHDGRPDRRETNYANPATRVDRNGDGRPDRIETARVDRDGFGRQHTAGQPQPQPVTVQQQQAPGTVPMAVPVRPQPVVSPTPRMSPQPQPVVSPTPRAPSTPQPLTSDRPVYASPEALPGAQPAPRPDRRDWNDSRRERRDGDGRNERQERPERQERQERQERPERQEHRPAPVTMAAPSAPVQQAAEVRFERPQRGDNERGREAPQRMAPPPPPAPAAAAAPAPAARPTPAQRAEERKHGDDRERKER
jgi:hypothetical protein